MKKSLWFLFILILSISISVFNLYAKGSAEDAIIVKVDAGRTTAEVSPYLINGFNLNNEMQVYTIKELIDKLNITTITYPAGNVGDERKLLNEYELTYFKSQQGYTGDPFTFVQARLFDGTPEQAAEAVKLAKKLDLRVDVWTIGNEPDLYATKRRDKSWTPEKYNKVFREFAQAMRAVDPDIKLAGPATSQPKDDWIRKFITECGDLVDVLAWHWYPGSGREEDESALATAALASQMIITYKDWLVDPKVNPKGYNRDIKTGITEWSIHWDTERFRHITDMVGVLWTAEVLGTYAELGIDYSHYFCLNKFGGHAIFNLLNKPRLLYYLFTMFADHYGTDVIPAWTQDLDLRVHASKHSDNDISVFIINQNPEEEKQIRINVDNFTNIKTVTAWELTKANKYKRISGRSVNKYDKKVVLKVSPFSVTVVRIKG